MFWRRVNRWLRCPTCKPARTRLEVGNLENRLTPTLNVHTIVAVGSGPGMDATVKVYNANGGLLDTFKPFPLPGGTFFGGGVHTAVGDINGDGVADVICGAGQGGGPNVKVFNGVDIAAGNANPGVLRDFFAYQPDFLGGVNVAVGDVNGDGLQDIITGAGPTGSPHVVAYSNGNQFSQLMNFFPYELTFRGGVNVACGDVGGDQTTDEVITGAGSSGGPKVNVYNFVANADPTLTEQQISSFYAYDPSVLCGVFVASGYATNNRDASNFQYADIITGAGQGGGAHVKVFRLLDAIDPNWSFFQAAEVFPYAPIPFFGGVRVGVVRNGSLDDFTTGPGQGGGPDFRIFNQTTVSDLQTYTPTQRQQIFPFPGSFTGGIYVS